MKAVIYPRRRASFRYWLNMNLTKTEKIVISSDGLIDLWLYLAYFST